MSRQFSLSPFLYPAAAVALCVCLCWISSKLYAAVNRRVLARSRSVSSPRLKISVSVMSPSIQRNRSISTFKARKPYTPPVPIDSSSKVELIVGMVIWTVNLCALTICVIAALSHFPATSVSCLTATRICGPLYTLIKTMIYMVALYRIESVYAGSYYAYDPRLLRGLNIVVVMTNSFLQCTVIWIKAEHKDLARLFGERIRMIECLGIYPDWIVALVAVQDLIVNCVCLHLFTKPLLLLLNDSNKKKKNDIMKTDNSGTGHSNTNTMDDTFSYNSSYGKYRGRRNRQNRNQFNEQMKRVASKFVVSSWTMIISTFLGLSAVAFTQTFSLLAIDLVINTLAVFFLTKWFDDSYGTICAIPIMIARLIPGCQVPERMSEEDGERDNSKAINNGDNCDFNRKNHKIEIDLSNNMDIIISEVNKNGNP